MSKELESISICFKNTEYCDVPLSDMAYMTLRGVSRTIGWRGNGKVSLDLIYCKSVEIKLLMDNQSFGFRNGSLKDRLTMGDVSSIYITWDDGSEEDIRPTTPENLDLFYHSNPWQKYDKLSKILTIKE